MMPVGSHVLISHARRVLQAPLESLDDQYIYLCCKCAEDFETPCVGRMAPAQCSRCRHCKLLWPSNEVVPVYTHSYKARYIHGRTGETS